MSGQLTRCSACGRLHFIAALIPHPDRPRVLLCPVRWRGLRISRPERDEANRLLESAFGDESAHGHEFPAADDIWPADAEADDWWNG